MAGRGYAIRSEAIRDLARSGLQQATAESGGAQPCVAALIPREFDPATSWLRLVTDTMIYRFRAFRNEGTPVWDIAVTASTSS
jgi:hypothetical protein